MLAIKATKHAKAILGLRFRTFEQNWKANSCNRGLDISFTPIAIVAEHLAVAGVGFAAFAPRGDVVSFHVFEGELLLALYADAFLALKSLSLLLLVERPNVEMPFVLCQKVGVDALLVGDIVVFHELRDPLFQFDRVEFSCLVRVVQLSPLKALHLRAIHRESLLHPGNDVLEVVPQGFGICIELVRAHVPLDVVEVDPGDDRLEVLLADGGAGHINAGKSIRCAVASAEITFRIRYPGSCVNRVAKLLLRQLLPGDVDGAEPIQAFRVLATTQIDGELIVHDLFPLICWPIL